MPAFYLHEILQATGGILLAGDPLQRFIGISTDTRTVKHGQVFVAVKGDNFEGHDFLAQAVAKGAAAVIVSRKDVLIPDKAAAVLVEDTVKAFGRIARYHRRRFDLPLIAVTGSAGKTSTKELIAAVLGRKYRVLFNKGTENNHMGVPASLLKLTRRHEVVVLEMGTNHPGEIAWLAENACPTMAVLTNVGASHLEGLGSPEGVFEEKASLLGFLPDDGCVVLNADDPYWARLLKKRLPQQVISYGIEAKADVKAGSLKIAADGISFKAGQGRSFALQIPSRGAVQNALAAIACGRFFKVPEAGIRQALKALKPAQGRQCLMRVKGVAIIDDTYNANPLSYKNAIDMLRTFKTRGRCILVAADMLELGPRSDELHTHIGELAGAGGVGMILTYGLKARLIGNAARKVRKGLDVRHFSDQAALVNVLKGILRPGDILCVKGSRGMRMEQVVAEIIAFLKG